MLPTGCRWAVHPTRFGTIHAPRTRSEKIKHQAILGSIPLEMVPALDERNEKRSGIISKRSDPITNILLRYEASPETELIQSMCKACAIGEFDFTVWEVLVLRANDLLPSLSMFDAGIILKCLMIFEAKKGLCVNQDLVGTLLRKLGTESGHGFFSILYGVQALNTFKHLLDVKTNRRYFNNMLKNLRYGSADTPLLIGCIQAISVRDPLPSTEIITPFFTELSARCETGRLNDSDADSIFGLLSAVARFPQSSAGARLLTEIKSHITDDYLSGYSTEQLVGIAHAFSRMGPAVKAKNIDIFTKVGNELARCDSWTPRTFAVALNAFGSASVAHADFLDSLIRISPKIVSSMDSTQTAMCIYGLSKLGCLNDFESLIVKAESKASEFDLHSISKIVAAVAPSRFNVDPYLEQVRNLLGNHQLTPEDTDSVSLILTSLRTNSIRSSTEMIDFMFGKLSRNIEACDLGKMSLLVNSFNEYNSESFKLFCQSILPRVLEQDVSLEELVRYLNAFASCLTLSHQESECMRNKLVSKAVDLPRLGYRSLTRLGVALVRCGIYDEDLMAAIDTALLKFIPTARKR